MANALVRPLERPVERPGFTEGFMALLSGVGFIVGTPAIWPLALVPVLVGAAATALVGAGSLHFVLPPIERAFGAHVPWLRKAVEILVVLLVVPIASVLGFGLAQPLSGPALNRIVRRVEEEVGAPSWPATTLLGDVGRALHSIAIAYSLGLPILAILYVVGFAFPPAVVVTLPLKILTLAMLIAWDLCDYPLSIHAIPMGKRVAFVGRNLRAMLGFGACLALLSLVPCALLLVLPSGVAGATRLTRRIELFEGSAR
jgi:CysZ protein